MKKHTLRKGSRIETIEGFIIINDFNGSIFYVDSYSVDEDGSDHFEGIEKKTPHEIEHMMQEVDGESHKVYSELADDEEE